MAIAKALIILVAITLGVYRIFALRRASVSSLHALGITFDRTAVSDLAVGVFIGFAGIGLVFAVEVTSEMSKITAISSPGVLTNDWLTWVMVPAIEELLFRSALLGGLLVVFSRAPWSAIAVAALVFGGAHALSTNASVLAVIGSTVGGVAYGMAFTATGKLWLPIGLHFAWNYAQGPLFGFPLSGGLVKQGSFIHLERLGPTFLTGGGYGPEGGTIGLIGRALVIALLAGYLWWCKAAIGIKLGQKATV